MTPVENEEIYKGYVITQHEPEVASAVNLPPCQMVDFRIEKEANNNLFDFYLISVAYSLRRSLGKTKKEREMDLEELKKDSMKGIKLAIDNNNLTNINGSVFDYLGNEVFNLVARK